MQTSKQDFIASHSARLYQRLADLPDSTQWFVGLSGGADSTSLLHLLAPVAAQCHAQLTALIVNHNLRADAAGEARAVQSWCQAAGISAEILTVTQSPPQAGRQEWARARRYELLSRRVRTTGGLLWLAHHYDDQCETIAMRLSHNSGLSGLAAMKEITILQSVPVLRPLLSVPKSDLVRFCDQYALHYVNDPSNDDARYERVRWRKILQNDDRLSSHLHQLSQLSARLDRHLQAAIAHFRQKRCDIVASGFGIACDKRAFSHLPALAKQMILRDMLHQVGDGGYPASIASVRRLIGRIDAGQGGTLAACLVRCSQNVITILPEAGRGHDTEQIAKGSDYLYQGRLIIRANRALLLSPMTAAHFAALPDKNSYKQALRGLPPEIRMIFPYLQTLDGQPITPHIKEVVPMGHFSQLGWSNEQVAIYPLSRLAIEHRYLGETLLIG